jgi:hypothetical protein
MTPIDSNSDGPKLSQVEDLLQHALRASAFEDHLIGQNALLPRRSWFGGGPMRFILTSAAACAVIGLTGFLFWRSSSSEQGNPIASGNTIAQTEPESLRGAPIALHTDALAPHGDLVVAIYRGEHARGDDCGECWCVRRWVPKWGAERHVNELEESELIDDSMVRSCVGDPRRVIVIGLSGPIDHLPKTDDQALELSLCLIGQAASDSSSCISGQLEYCMTSWSRTN